MLVAQIDGGDPAVARAALSVLEEATQDERCLRTLVGSPLATSSVPCSYILLSRVGVSRPWHRQMGLSFFRW